MEVQINVDQAISRITSNFAQLSKKDLHASIAAAINRTLISGRVEGSKKIKGIYNIRQAVLDGSFQITKARSSLLVGNIQASTKAISLSHFQPSYSFTRTSKTNTSKSGVGVTRLLKGKSKIYGKGVTVEIIKGNRVSVPYAFMIAGKKPVFARGDYQSSGKYGFIQRHKRVNKTGPDTPITSLVNISVYSSIINKKVMPDVNIKVSDKFQERLLHELNYRLSKMQSS